MKAPCRGINYDKNNLLNAKQITKSDNFGIYTPPPICTEATNEFGPGEAKSHGKHQLLVSNIVYKLISVPL